MLDKKDRIINCHFAVTNTKADQEIKSIFQETIIKILYKCQNTVNHLLNSGYTDTSRTNKQSDTIAPQKQT